MLTNIAPGTLCWRALERFPSWAVQYILKAKVSVSRSHTVKLAPLKQFHSLFEVLGVIFRDTRCSKFEAICTAGLRPQT